ncbi:class F sortase [Kribbella speibonae]|uniref:Class F sortase n=1 Tax=Kribbella speibonae TaxID=1572660 RepID=A0A4R0J9J7_9ACTN|nr:class F sortase [Kribbella speibonae]
MRTDGSENPQQAGGATTSPVGTTGSAPRKPTTAQSPSAGFTQQTSPTQPQQSGPPPEVRSTARPQPGDPIRLSVPRLGVSARVLSIRARGGTLVPPSNPLLVGWWSDGARPGATKGSAIITGHTVHTGGGAFDDLDRLTAGDAVAVTTRRGAISYVVTSVTVYRKRALAKQAAKVFDQSVPGRLVLVTCEDWDGTAYLSNAVVIAVPKT